MIAYLLPGFIAVVALSGPIPEVASWLAASSEGQPTVGGFLYVTVTSLAAGMFASSVRWLTIDSLHHRTGVKPPTWDFSKLQSNLSGYNLLVEFHYRYYQFNANTFVVVAFAYVVRLAGGCPWCSGAGWTDVGFLIVEVVLFATSRDTLRKYYVRVSQVLAASGNSRREKCHVKWRRTRTRTRNEERNRSEGQSGQRDASEAGEAGDSPERPGGEE